MDRTCTTYTVPDSLISITEEESYSLPNQINKLAVRYVTKHKGTRGDLVYFESIPKYRNRGIFIFDGVKLCKLDTTIDDYGALPPQFTPIEEGLPVTYWADSIDYNYIIWIMTETIRDNIEKYPKEGTIPGTKVIGAYCTFKFNKVTYTVIFDDEGQNHTLDYKVDRMIKVIYSSIVKYPFTCKSDICTLKNAVFMID